MRVMSGEKYDRVVAELKAAREVLASSQAEAKRIDDRVAELLIELWRITGGFELRATVCRKCGQECTSDRIARAEET